MRANKIIDVYENCSNNLVLVIRDENLKTIFAVLKNGLIENEVLI